MGCDGSALVVVVVLVGARTVLDADWDLGWRLGGFGNGLLRNCSDFNGDLYSFGGGLVY